MLCAVDNFPLVLAGFPVKPGMTDYDHGMATDRVSSRYRERVPHCHLDRAERVERSPSPTYHPRQRAHTTPQVHKTQSDSFFTDHEGELSVTDTVFAVKWLYLQN